RGGRPLEEHELVRIRRALEGALEDPLLASEREDLLFEFSGRCRILGISHGIHRSAMRPLLFLVDASSSRPLSTRATSAVSTGSAERAMRTISSMLVGASASGRHMSVMVLTPSTRMPMWRATITSGTVLMPTASTPIERSIRYSARVSRLGPATAAYTPRRNGMPSASAAAAVALPRAASYGADMSGKRGPRSSRFGPISGLSPIRLM